MSTTQPNGNGISNRPVLIALGVGVAAALVGVGGLLISGPGAFFQAYLFAFLFWLAVSLGSLAILLLHFVTAAKWGLTIRRVVEAGAGSLWAMAILFIPLIFGMPYIYAWARPAEVAASTVLQNKAFYLNVPFFVARAVVYFAIWIVLAATVNRRAARLSAGGADAEAVHDRLQGFSAFGLVLYSVTMTFAAIDWQMSIEPFWSSTIFGMLAIVTQVMAAMSFAILVLNLFPSLGLGRRWGFKQTPVPYRDLGALLLTLVMGWAYLAYFQLLIIWAGNIPREVVWYTRRTEGGWVIPGIFIALFQFAVPFFMLLSIRARYSMRVLAALSGLLLLTNLVNMFWSVKPAFTPTLGVTLADVALPFAIGGLWLAAFFYTLQRRPALNALDQAVVQPEAGAEGALAQH